MPEVPIADRSSTLTVANRIRVAPHQCVQRLGGRLQCRLRFYALRVPERHRAAAWRHDTRSCHNGCTFMGELWLISSRARTTRLVTGIR